MIELWLNFTDEKGEAKRVLVEGEKFAIGRTPDNDLQIPVSNLSRQHAEIQRFADVFVISDLGSSNGTTLNGEDLEKPIGLKNGDKLDLGGLEMEVEIISDKGQGKGKGGGSGGDEDEDEDELPASSAKVAAAGASGSNDKSSISPMLLIAAPIFGVIILLMIGGVFLISRGNGGSDVVQNGKTPDFTRTPKNNDSPAPDDTPTKSVTPPTNSPLPGNDSNSVPPTPGSTEEVPTPKTDDEATKIGKNAGSFLKLISNDPKAFLTDAQISLVNKQIGQFKGSSGLAENIRNAQKSASEIKSLADSKDLRPQFLANAALTKLGNQRGDVVGAAREILEQLSAITKAFGNDTSDDSLLIIAALSNNTSGDSLQSTAGVFTKKDPGSARKIRSIWFFKEKGKITPQQFDYALQYLAIGAITQNPKDFNIQTEPLTF
jgi:hypothetical protein